MRLIFAFLLVCCVIPVFSQNLVSNPSFEAYTSCPTYFSQISYAAPWTDARRGFISENGTYMTGGSTDFFHQCAAGRIIGVPDNFTGTNNARTGKGHAGIYTFWYGAYYHEVYKDVIYREYLQGQFNKPLEAGKKYQVNFYVKGIYNINTITYLNMAIEDIGAYLSILPVYQNDYPYELTYFMETVGNIRVEPQVKNTSGNILIPSPGWHEIKGVYTATGGEKYITLGNFKDNQTTNYTFLSPTKTDGPSTAYHLVDDVSVIPCDRLISLGKDTTICEGEKLFYNVYSPVTNYKFRWQDGSEKTYYEITKPGTYWIEAVSAQDCITRDTLIVKATEQVNLGNDTTLCPLQTYTLDASLGKGPYLWSDGSTEPTLEVTQAGTYWVKAYNSKGCEIGDTITLSFNSLDCLDDIPNVITPNGDGKNDTFVINGIENEPIEIEIVNRFGKKIYYNADYKNQWGDFNVTTGLYYYRIINRKSKRTLSGWIQVLY